MLSKSSGQNIILVLVLAFGDQLCWWSEFMQPSSCFFLFDGWLLVMLRTMMIILVVSSDFLVAGWCVCWLPRLYSMVQHQHAHTAACTYCYSTGWGCLAAGVLTANTRTKNE